MKVLCNWVFAASLMGISCLVSAAQIDDIRMWTSPEGTRLVFDISAPLEHEVFVLKNPDRIVVDFKNTSLTQQLPNLDFSKTDIQDLRSAKRNQYDLRVVLDAKKTLRPKSFLLKPMGGYGYRLVLDLDNPQAQSRESSQNQAPISPQTLAKDQSQRTTPSQTTTPPQTTTPSTTLSTTPSQTTPSRPQAQVPTKTLDSINTTLRPVVVAIDAGHGGEDPGAIGKYKTEEKQVVLSIANRLYNLLEKEKGVQPVLIREGDYYISLRGRIRKARAHKADLFISIHADAAKNRSANGASVFVLSQKGASSEAARWLAATQNDSDRMGGVSLDDKDDLLASVLVDVSQNATIAASTSVGESILQQLGEISEVHKGVVERAGFVVLKSPDIPSILVETGFISNVKEEHNLRSAVYQQKIANSIKSGVTNYFRQNPPAGTLFAYLSHQRADAGNAFQKGPGWQTFASQ